MNTNYILPENKGYFFQAIWNDNSGSSHPITAICTYKDKKFEFTSENLKIKATLEELSELFTKAFSEISKKDNK
jgi:hypothetical protein